MRPAAITRAARIGLHVALLGSLLLPGRAGAEKTVHRVETRLALAAQGLVEELITAAHFTGVSFNLAARYGLCRGMHLFDVGIEFGSGPDWTRGSDPALYVHSEIYLAYLLRALSRPQRALWLGALVRSSHEFAYLVSYDEDHGYWLDAVMLGPAVRHAEQLLPGLALEASADVSLVGVSSRPPAQQSSASHEVDDGEYHFDRLSQNPRFAWLGSTSLLRAELLVRWRERARPFGTGLGIGIEARLAIATDPARYRSWYLGLPFSFAFGAP